MSTFRSYIRYILSLHIIALFILSLFRIYLFLSNKSLLQVTSEGDITLILKAFIRGIWFDNVMGCYILLLPLTLILLLGIFRIYNKVILQGIALYLTIFYSLAFALSAANVPYFSYFFKNINSSILNWASYGGTTMKMMTGETLYIFPILSFIIASIIFGRFSFKSINQINQDKTKDSNSSFYRIIFSSAYSVILIGLCILGIRGRIGYNPIKVSAAYYCNDPFLNQLGLNPTFNLLITTMDDHRKENLRLSLMDDKKAIRMIMDELEIPQNKDNSLVRFIKNSKNNVANDRRLKRTNDTSISLPFFDTKPNIVIIFMESMSASFMKTFGQEQNLTPFLDSLYSQSWSFRNFYSSGIHTNHGLYSTLYSFPTILKRNAMKGSDIPNYDGFPTTLKRNGYHNMFFMTHESQYDNMNGFFRTNGFDDIYSQENYPPEQIVNSFGVSDEFLFEYGIPVLNKSKTPFFATFLTISNHPPYVIPDNFKTNISDKEMSIVCYADACLKKFFLQAKKQKWFNNTIFVFLADHGKMVGTPTSEMPESYNHIPLMIYSSKLKPHEFSNFGTQIDVAPTLLGMMGIDNIQIDLGVDMLKKRRKRIMYTADNLLCSRDSEYMYICEPETNIEYIYKILNNHKLHKCNLENSFNKDLTSRINKLRYFGLGTLQATESIVRDKKTIINN